MSEWSAEDRQRFDEAKRVLQSGDVSEVAKLLQRSQYCVGCERLQAERDEWHRRARSVNRKLSDAEAELDRMRPIVATAILVSDADLSVYDDVPEAHGLMYLLDLEVEAYRAAKGADDE